MVIDPLAAIIQYLLNDEALSELVNDRIAAKHKFAMEKASHLKWPTPSRALQVQLDPQAKPDLYGGTQPVRLKCLCFGHSQSDAMLVYGELFRIALNSQRTLIALSNNKNALLYYFFQDSIPLFINESNIKVDAVLIYFQASLSNCSIEV